MLWGLSKPLLLSSWVNLWRIAVILPLAIKKQSSPILLIHLDAAAR
jgi:hypothetical protein